MSTSSCHTPGEKCTGRERDPFPDDTRKSVNPGGEVCAWQRKARKETAMEEGDEPVTTQASHYFNNVALYRTSRNTGVLPPV